jgi:two-component system, chemotaxis family, response regulator Rcp1
MNATLAKIRPAEILLVEDNDNDVELTRIAFGASKLPVNLHHAKDGEVCLAFLRKQGRFADAPTPDLILLDLNMPRMSGWEALEEISRDENLSHLPVVILTTSQDEREILEMYRLRCSSYIVKPLELDRFLHAIRVLLEYWLTVVVLPS